ncbi:hypothetical protein D3C80_1655430 [compost metagenome]
MAPGEISPWAMVREALVPSLKSKSPSWRWICWAISAGLSNNTVASRRNLVMVTVLESVF